MSIVLNLQHMCYIITSHMDKDTKIIIPGEYKQERERYCERENIENKPRESTRQ